MLELVATSAGDSAVVVAIVAMRLLLPLLIPRFPLVIVAALVVDAADQTILQRLTEVDTTETGPYQGFDKALDVYYLSIAYLSTMRNWTSDAAFRIAQFLFFYRLVGVTLFELADERWMLLVFANTFEYFFIAYELVRLRRDPAKISARFWLLLALGIWVFVKLPQEYWIHVAKLDTTDLLRAHPWLGVLGALAIVGLVAFALVYVRPRLPAPDWALRPAADPLPTEMDEAHERHAYLVRTGRLLSGELFEKAIGLLSLICIIFVSIIPAVEMAPLQIAIGVTAVVLANSAVSLWFARRGGFGIESQAVSFGIRLALNVLFVYLATVLLRGDSSFHFWYGTFFAYLITLIVWLYDFYRPVYDVRFERSTVRIGSLSDFARRVRARQP
jgi:hypothetical protein